MAAIVVTVPYCLVEPFHRTEAWLAFEVFPSIAGSPKSIDRSGKNRVVRSQAVDQRYPSSLDLRGAVENDMVRHPPIRPVMLRELS